MHILIFILILAGLVLVHEFGHFIVAKMFGMTVEEFSIGFPPRLLSVKWRGTVYSINLIFVGGFVRILGEDPEEDTPEKSHADKKSGSFSSKSRFAQGAVVLAGVSMNFLVAWILLVGAYMVGMPSSVDDNNRARAHDVRVEIVNVLPNTPAGRVGMQAGDVLTSMQTAIVQMPASSTADQAREFIQTAGDKSLVVFVNRAGVKHTFIVVPQVGVLQEDMSRKAIGVAFADVGVVKSPLPYAFADGAHLFARETIMVAEGIGGFFLHLGTGTLNMNEVSGPVGIARAGGSAVSDGYGALMMFAALVSINLAFMNLLPIPGLDGGRLIFIIIEAIRGKPIARKWYERFAITGFSLLCLLMLVVTYHDIFR